MKITLLGTGTSVGIPALGQLGWGKCNPQNPKNKRQRCAVLIQSNNTNILIDAGPDIKNQLINHNLPSLDGIIITHEHADHTTGIDDVRPFFFRQGKIPIYLNNRVLDSLKERFAYIFDPEKKYPGSPDFDINIIENNKSFQISDLEITPIESMHLKLPVFGYIIKDFAYLTDVKTITELELNKLNGLDSLVINALRFEPHPSHLNVDEAIEIINLIKPKKTYFTHISHNMGFHQEVCKKLPKNGTLAYDGLVLKIY